MKENGFVKSWEMRSGRLKVKMKLAKEEKMNKIWKDERKDTYRRERERVIEEKCSRVWEESENENDTRERERERVLLGWVGFTNTTLQNLHLELEL
jgi:hypothetical protein